MERKDQQDTYREQRAESRREMGPQYQDYRGREGQERPLFEERERTIGQSFDWDRDQWQEGRGRAMSEGGRQYEQPAGGYGYGRQGYTAGQSGQGYYGARSMSERPPGMDYGGPRYTSGARPFGEAGYGARESFGQYAGLGPKNYRRSDERIQDDVCYRLTQDPAVDASNIEVVVVNREVTLAGTVPTREQRRQAEDIADQVAGVSHVQNNVRVSRSEGWGASRDSRSDVARDETDFLISADKVEGTAVYGSDRQKMGTIKSLMLTKRSGKVAYAVLSFGGFLGLGTEYYPLPWNALKYDTRLEGYVIDLTKEQLQSAPRYGENDAWDWNDPATGRRIDQYYNVWMGTFY